MEGKRVFRIPAFWIKVDRKAKTFELVGESNHPDKPRVFKPRLTPKKWEQLERFASGDRVVASENQREEIYKFMAEIEAKVFEPIYQNHQLDFFFGPLRVEDKILWALCAVDPLVQDKIAIPPS